MLLLLDLARVLYGYSPHATIPAQLPHAELLSTAIAHTCASWGRGAEQERCSW